ncbi:hypothetical protein BJV78DRAFT_1233081 [Lactifluus subvellereus]|nr:hypothetical protein BJV78DRAFT_1233081 [Lactifluus subvellereus]
MFFVRCLIPVTFSPVSLEEQLALVCKRTVPDYAYGRQLCGIKQVSLMAIVEGVTRQNRAAWDHANAGLPAESAITTGTVSGLVSMRAPPPVTKYNIRGEGGRGIAFETVFTPGSVLVASPQALPLVNSGPQPPTSLSLSPRPAWQSSLHGARRSVAMSMCLDKTQL